MELTLAEKEAINLALRIMAKISSPVGILMVMWDMARQSGLPDKQKEYAAAIEVLKRDENRSLPN